MPAIRGITVSIGYGQLLRITLPLNMRHFHEAIVITSPEDRETQDVASSIPGVHLHVTDAATRHRARFNKGLCFEEAWDRFGRDGWWLIHDSDICFPDSLPLDGLNADKLYGARRRILADPSKWRPDLVWATCPVHLDGGPIGFFQLANGDGKSLKHKRPWYDVTFTHAGGGDAYFMDLFPPSHRRVLPIDVLHLGRPDHHWFGTDQAGIDMMARYVHENGWHRAQRHHTRDARSPAARADICPKDPERWRTTCGDRSSRGGWT
jgi:hypothetical protein